MKKVKVMLTGIAVLAAVGGGLAFKAKSTFGFTIYTSTIENQCGTELRNHTIQATPVTEGQISVYYTTVPDDPNCTAKAYTAVFI